MSLWKRRNIYQQSILGFHVCLRGRTVNIQNSFFKYYVATLSSLQTVKRPSNNYHLSLPRSGGLTNFNDSLYVLLGHTRSFENNNSKHTKLFMFATHLRRLWNVSVNLEVFKQKCKGRKGDKSRYVVYSFSASPPKQHRCFSLCWLKIWMLIQNFACLRWNNTCCSLVFRCFLHLVKWM